MSERVAVAGVGQTSFAPAPDRTFAELAHEAATAALEDAGLKVSDVDNVVTASNDFWDGRTISSMAVSDAVGAAAGSGRSVSTVEGDGGFAAFYGMSRILSGAYRTTLVVAHSKGSEGDPRLITNAYFDPVLERPLGLDAVSAAALQARAYLERRGLGPEDCARVAAKNRAHGAANPKAHLRQALSVEEALAAPFAAPPLRRDDVAPVSDGAAAVLLAGEAFARKRCPKPVWIEGVGLAADARLDARDLSESRALREAARKAYRMAGVWSPEREIDAAEVSEAFSYQELLWLDELGLAGHERVNLSGGCLSAHAEIAAGLARIVEAALQLRGEAARQAPSVRRALAHGQHGLCGASHCVWVLGNGS